jgi:transcriptional regulator with AAA-type ATPase domain
MLDETTHATKQHEAMVENHRSKFVGRKNLIKECLKQMKEITSSGGIISLTGKAGTVKSAVLVRFSVWFHTKVTFSCSLFHIFNILICVSTQGHEKT